MTRAKVCGITNLADALAAVEAGASALGFVLAAGPRRVTPETAERICRALPPFVDRVGVFVDAHLDPSLPEACRSFLTAFQFHGEEPPEFVAGWRFGTRIRALRVRRPEDLASGPGHPGLEEWEAAADAVLLDARSPRAPGGTGESFDWGILQGVVLRKPLVLAGGLGPDNVGEAIRRVRPYAVDASTRLEAEPGRKDPEKVRRFLAAVREADRALEQA